MAHVTLRNIRIAACFIVILGLLWCLRSTRLGNPRTFPNALPRSTASHYALSNRNDLANPAHQKQVNALYQSAPDDFFVGANGVRIYYKIFAQPAGLERGAVVISSGRTESSELYKELIYDLYKQQYSVYIHDHRGQGFSERLYLDDTQRGHVENFDYYVDLHLFIQGHVRPQTHSRLFVLAHSMGGGIATRYIEKYDDGVRALALVTPMHGPLVNIAGLDVSDTFCSGSRTSLAATMLSAAEFGLGQHPWRPTPFQGNDLTHSSERFSERNQVTNKLGGVTHGWFRQACRGGKEARTEANRIAIPVLILQAGRDTAVSNRAQREFCDRMAEGKGRCVAYVLPDAYHAIFLEEDDLRTPALTKILDFFAENT